MPKTNIFPLFFLYAENVKFNTTGKCGGQILVNYRNKWEHVCFGSPPSQSQELLCQNLGCGGYNSSIRKLSNSYRVNLCCTPLSSILETFSQSVFAFICNPEDEFMFKIQRSRWTQWSVAPNITRT